MFGYLGIPTHGLPMQNATNAQNHGIFQNILINQHDRHRSTFLGVGNCDIGLCANMSVISCGGGANLNRRVNACCFSCLFLFLPLLTRGVEGKVAGERVFGPWPILVKSCIVQNSPLSLL